MKNITKRSLYDIELKRVVNLGKIADKIDSKQKQIQIDMQVYYDNNMALRENEEAWKEIVLGIPSKVIECHLRRCIANSVEYCTCYPDRLISKGEPL